MIAVAEAERLIREQRITPSVNKVPLATAVGHTLAEIVCADRDLPPYARVAMDGIAIFWKEELPATAYPIEHVHGAGDPPYALQDASACVEVMTGSVLPEGTTAVIPYEDLQLDARVARVLRQPRMGQHIHVQGADVRQGAVLLRPGTIIGPKQVAILAAIGVTHVPVFVVPPVAIVSTGNELVDISAQPAPHQIRTSNSHALAAALARLKITSELYHLPDHGDTLHAVLPGILERHALVILSGGVSKGKFDLIPQALKANGIQQIFHQIQQKPGKPFWFGRSRRTTVFALPGNPVSTFLCYHRYIKPWLQTCLHHDMQTETASLHQQVTFQPPLTCFLQVKVENEQGLTVARPLAGGGSGDFVNLLRVDGFLELPPDRSEFLAGEQFPLIRFD